MMPTWFGHWQAWILLVLAWLALGALSALALGLIARVGAWRNGDDTR